MKDSFGLRLRYFRTKLNMTQQQLAEKSGVSRKQISDFEMDIQNNPRQSTLKKLADALEISILNLKPDLEIPSDLHDDVKKSLKVGSTPSPNIVSYEVDISDLSDEIINKIEDDAKKSNRSFDEQFNILVRKLLINEINKEKIDELSKNKKDKDAENSFLNHNK